MCCASTIQLLGDVPAGLTGRPVLLVDDIVDTGRSLSYAAAELSRCGRGKLWTCALLDKPQRRQVEVALDFVGFVIPDMWSATAPTSPRNTAISLYRRRRVKGNRTTTLEIEPADRSLPVHNFPFGNTSTLPWRPRRCA